MSGALVSASRLKPEIRLAQAVSQFEADLSSDQKATLRTYRSQIQKVPPDPRDVMRLTAEIDRRATGKIGGGRCFGPRLTNFLHAVQAFTAIGDVMIGGSQNIIACGVWSLVRMSLLSIVNVSSYLEKLSSLFMIAGRSAPRYQSIALLYPRSKKLQSALSEYFIVVVSLCHTLFMFTQKSTIGQFASSLSDSKLKTYQSNLDLWANSIQEEVSMLVAEKIEEEAHENTHFRALWSRSSKSTSLEQKLKTRLLVLDFCSTYDYETPWRQIRKVGNTTFFNQITDYQDWKGQADSCTLLYIGKLGSGKSVLLANIVDDLNLCVDTKDVVVAYFFCRYDLPESLDAETVIKSLVRQMLQPIPDLAMVSEFLDDTTSPLDFERMTSLLQRALPSAHKAYFVLDGLDECHHDERNKLILQLRKLQDSFTMLLCISFRLEPDNAPKLNSEEFIGTRSISIPEDNPDIEFFIEGELEDCIKSKKLVLGSPSLVLEIRDALLRGSQGMFLWVALQIKSLCAMKTDDAIRRALVDLPKDLSEMFARILARSELAEQLYQKRILELVTVAQHPLHIEELREALCVVPGNTTWNPANLPNDIYSTLACCGSLLTVDEEELTVRLVHHSAKQFLLTGFNASKSSVFTAADAHRTMLDIIVTYLSYGIFDTRLSTIVVPQIRTASVPSKIIHSTLDSSSSIRSLALKLLKSKREPNYDIGKTIIEEGKLFDSCKVDEYHFYSYAKSCWQQHFLDASESGPAINNLHRRLLESETVDISLRDKHDQALLSQAVARGHVTFVKLLLETVETDIESRDPHGQTPLSLAAADGYKYAVKLLLVIGKVNVESKDSGGRTPLSWAAANGHEAVVELLLVAGKANIESKDSGDRTPLSWAARNGHKAVVELLLATGKAKIDLEDNKGRTPLSWAAGNGHEAIVKLLLATDKADIESMDNTYNKIPLLWAAENGHKAVVELLIATGMADIELKDKYGRTPLSRAAANGHEAVVKLLLVKGNADINLKDSLYYQTPLSWAAENGHEAVVKLLLATGKADIESKNINGQTPLSLVAGNGHEAIVKLLLVTGNADIESKDTCSWTPLSIAAVRGQEAIVKLLLAAGKANIESKNIDGRTPLSLAASNGNVAVVKLLLTTGKANVNSKDNEHRTPLLWAATRGHEAVVKLLLATGKVDIESENLYGQTPLSVAAGNGHEAVVKLLLIIGKANVESKDMGNRTPLLLAAENGHEAIVKLLLVIGKADTESEGDYGRTPLFLAAMNGHAAVVKRLLVTGKANVESKDTGHWTSLSVAAGNGYEAVVKLLLATGKADIESKDKDGRTPLSWAVRNGHEAVVKLLLIIGKANIESEDNMHKRTPLSWAADNGNEAIVKLLLATGKADTESKDKYGRTPLSWAVRNGHEAVVKLLLITDKDNVESEDNGGQTPLSWAAENGNEAVVKLLLVTRKADIESPDRKYQTPLSRAAMFGHEAVVKLLLATGKVNIESKDEYSRTPLSWAAENGHEAVVKLLLATGKVDIESGNLFGQTPLSVAAMKGHEAVVKLLLATGEADIESKDIYDRTPLSLAAKGGHKAVVKLLKSRSGSV